MPHPSLFLALALASLAVGCATPAATGSVAPARGEWDQTSTSALLRPYRPRPAAAVATSRAMLGVHQLDEDFWSPIDRNLAFGFETAFENTDYWLGFEWGGFASFGDDSEVVDDPSPGTKRTTDYEFYEAYIGAHRTFFRQSFFRPYVGAGVAFIYWDADKKVEEPGQPVVKADRDHWTYGVYAHGGVAFQLTENMQIGIDARALFGTEVDNLLGDGDLDYQRISIFIGFGG